MEQTFTKGSLMGVLLAVADPAMAGSPEVGILNLITNISAMGLLAYLVVWGLPKWNKEIREDRHQDRNALQIIVGQLSEQREADRQHFEHESKYEREQCERHFESMTNLMAKTQESTVKALESLKDSQNTLAHAIHEWGKNTDPKK